MRIAFREVVRKTAREAATTKKKLQQILCAESLAKLFVRTDESAQQSCVGSSAALHALELCDGRSSKRQTASVPA